ncbi:hypothetical protein BFJ63_vAg16053 [Fusarium oxysporum f. sp. narcissi]|uniref:Uncharacterized protein n=1 Tax=Fusarium oxysporum f. sp. narcissi TaxID=451672 RepID=A0A4Q2V2A6_FUSOX|nr:hypothetical protein BFJ63_vAg16053 [Fusarium oxysporum f. sp. narcissi]
MDKVFLTYCDVPQKLAGVLHTCLPSRSVEPGKFGLGAVDHDLWKRLGMQNWNIVGPGWIEQLAYQGQQN